MDNFELSRHTQSARWYCVSRCGMATLCIAEDDAKAEAAKSNIAYPNSAPYKAVQFMEVPHDVAAERARWVAACCAVYGEAMEEKGPKRNIAADTVMAIRKACGA